MDAENTTTVVMSQQSCLFDDNNERCQRSRMEFHDRIKAARTATGLSQKTFAVLVSRHLGARFTQQALSRLEAGKSKSSKAMGSLAAISGYNLDWLLREEGEMFSSQPLSADAAKWTQQRDELGLTNETVHQRLISMDWPEGIEPPDLQLVVEWFDGRRRPVDMIYRGMLYKALGFDEAPKVIGAPEAQTEIEQEYLNMIRTGSDEEAAAMLLAWKAARQSRHGGNT